ncbi:SDR family NAD(P)-dependent oxidoreductase [Alteribacillus sp. HJP-4]|uniref:SDR family NAD(P)-dependent oxidoreductase n=1 Tax=Alteribacillus sp. HJP-4 TaxID=2775394 RepID=UPI0035CD1C22
MDLQLAGKKVLITGASKGIGRGIAALFSEEGADVGIAARPSKNLAEAAAAIQHAKAFEADLTHEVDRESLIAQFLDTFGTIDILVNNAGGSNGAAIADTSMSDFKEAMELNYYSAVHLSKLVLPIMKANKAGSIVNISSIYGRESGGKPTYNNSKAAMISFTKALADESILDGVRVNSVAPGAILHSSGNWQKRLEENPDKINEFVAREIPAGRFGTVEEIANTVVFLASEKASWISGASINVDGGQSKMNM